MKNEAAELGWAVRIGKNGLKSFTGMGGMGSGTLAKNEALHC
jgi:hypothetical protein